MSTILPNVQHIVVVMLENRSLDSMLGSLYSGDCTPGLVLPPGSAVAFDGLKPGLSNPTNQGFFAAGPFDTAPVQRVVESTTVPDPDPQETFDNVTFQLFGPEAPNANPKWPNQGFLLNYATTKTTDPTQVLQCHGPGQVPILSTLARSYAVSDAWFASVPSQTWPNRAFVHAGTSNGRVNNGQPPDPLQWNVPTIFNVLSKINTSWVVFHDTTLVPSLTRTMFPKLWDGAFDPHFLGFQDFVNACANNALPKYSFVEPSFLLDPNDAHPPHDVNAGEAFLHAIWTAVSTSPGWNQTLLVITFDEHGGCYDHVLPPFGAKPPDAASAPGDKGFGFDRFGVRVPTIVVSPYVAAGTVFRSDGAVPYDHTSILATLRDWIGIEAATMLPSARVAQAPTLAQVLSLQSPRTDLPTVLPPSVSSTFPPLSAAPNDLQRSLVSGTARRDGLDPTTEDAKIQTRQHAVEYFARRSGRTKT
jgi:phospholipase C